MSSDEAARTTAALRASTFSTAGGSFNGTTTTTPTTPMTPTTTTTMTTTRNGQQHFTSNMCAVLNDPRKDRNKTAYLFTKTWGNDFVDTAQWPPISSIHPNYKQYKLADFKAYLDVTVERNIKYSKNRLDYLNSQQQQQTSTSTSAATISSSSSSNQIATATLNLKQQQQQQQAAPLQRNELDQIPKIFFDANFSLSNKETFNAIISSQLLVELSATANHRPHNQTQATQSVTSLSPSRSSGGTQELRRAHTCKDVLDRLSHYLDITETHISKQISTKANTFFTAIHSQDEVQEHVLRTCAVVKSLRQNIRHFDQHVLVMSMRVIKLVTVKLRFKNLIEKLELMASVYQTQPTIQLHLASAEFTGALDLIALSQDILRQDLRGVRALRHFDSQFAEIEKVIDKMLHQEFSKYLISDLSRDFALGSGVMNQDKLCSLLLGMLRLKTTTFVELCKDEILIYLKSTVKQTVVDYVSQVEEDAPSNAEDESTIRLIDRVRNLRVQEFLHLLSKVLSNIKTMLMRVHSLLKVTASVVNSAAGVVVTSAPLTSPLPPINTNTTDSEQDIKDVKSSSTSPSRTQHSIEQEQSQQDDQPILLDRELISKAAHGKLVASMRELMSNASDYAQERLVNLLEGKFKDNGLDRLSSNDFISLSNLIDQFVIDFDAIVAQRRTSALRSWVQNQANKFLHRFHADKKDKLTLALDSERWKQAEISSDIQNLLNHILSGGLGLALKPTSSASATASAAAAALAAAKARTTSDFLLIGSEKYVIFATVIVIIKLMVDYCQFAVDLPNLSFDVMTRLIEIFKMFNTKTYQMILGGGAAQAGVLRIITFKTLAITYRCLECVLHCLPLVRDFFRQRLVERQAHTDKQFGQLTRDYADHKSELSNKLLFMMDDILRELLAAYEVIAPVPSQCFRAMCQQITRVHEIFSEVFADVTLVELFTEIHARFKRRLAHRLRELNVQNDGGPQHALIFSDMTYYIKQFKSLNKLHLISLNFEDVWAAP